MGYLIETPRGSLWRHKKTGQPKRVGIASLIMFLLVFVVLALTPAAAHAKGKGYTSSPACLTPSTRALLSQIEDRFGRVKLLSTCRPGARVRGTGRMSLHSSGRAIDFDAGRRKSEVVRWLVHNHNGGVMTYRHSRHIHVDVGPRFVILNHGGKSKRKRKNRR